MKTKRFCFFIILPLLFSSCAMNYFYTFQPENANTGKVVIIPIAPTSYTYVKLNDSLIIANKNIKTLTLENLPYGTYTMQYASYNPAYKASHDKHLIFKVENDSKQTQIVSVPPISSGYWIYAGLITSTLYAVLYMPLIFAK
ncbi:MAG: hypothetical protein Q7U47_08230 [Paludibacter sp.]|nr:hypothetical protein [Paludibacter sp.]